MIRSHRFLDDPLYAETPVYIDEHRRLDLAYRKAKVLSHPMFLNVMELFIDHNALTALPAPEAVPHLTELNASYNRILSVPWYPNLTHLNVSHNRLAVYPMTSARVLDCSHNRGIVALALPDCRELYTTHNGMTALDLAQYPRLQLLDCGHNRLTALRGSVTLRELNAESNRLTRLGEYPVLEHLIITDNGIKTLPTYPRLQELLCDRNRLTVLSQPAKTISAVDNRITIAMLPEAMSIDLSNNRLVKFLVGELVTHLTLLGNPVADLHLNKRIEQLDMDLSSIGPVITASLSRMTSYTATVSQPRFRERLKVVTRRQKYLLPILKPMRSIPFERRDKEMPKILDKLTNLTTVQKERLVEYLYIRSVVVTVYFGE